MDCQQPPRFTGTGVHAAQLLLREGRRLLDDDMFPRAQKRAGLGIVQFIGACNDGHIRVGVQNALKTLEHGKALFLRRSPSAGAHVIYARDLSEAAAADVGGVPLTDGTVPQYQKTMHVLSFLFGRKEHCPIKFCPARAVCGSETYP